MLFGAFSKAENGKTSLRGNSMQISMNGMRFHSQKANTLIELTINKVFHIETS